MGRVLLLLLLLDAVGAAAAPACSRAGDVIVFVACLAWLVRFERRRLTLTGLRRYPAGPPLWTTGPLLVILVTMSESLPLAEVKSHLSELISRVHSQHERVTVTVHGRPSAVLIAVEDLEALEETIAVLSDSDTLRQLAASSAELARGEGEDIEALHAAMKQRRDPA